MRRLLLPVLAAVLFASGISEAQVVTLLGPEIQVNTYTSNRQQAPRVARASNGDFVVVWESRNQGGTAYNYDVFGQRYASSGAPLGGAFRVNSYTPGTQRAPAVAFAPSGDFDVVWSGIDAAGIGGVFLQRFSSAGAPLGGELRVSSHNANEIAPSIATDASGNFVVSWGDGYESFRPHALRFASSGTPLGAEFTVALTAGTGLSFQRSSVAVGPSGDFVIVWDMADSADMTAAEDVWLRRFSSNGTSLSSDTRVNTYTSGPQFQPRAAMDGAGNFVVVWRDGSTASYITGQRFNNIGNPVGGEFRVNSLPGVYIRQEPSIASDPAGDFIVAWDGQDPSASLSSNAFARIFNANGSPRGNDFRLNTNSGSGDFKPSVATDGAGNFVAVWENQGLDGAVQGVFAQRFCPNLVSSSIAIVGPTNVCPGGTGGTLTVTDNGGGLNGHSWGYRTTSMGTTTAIAGQTGTTYVLNAGNTLPSVMALFIVCTTVPTCGSVAVSNEIGVFKGDVTGPGVTAPVPATVRQTLCQ